MKSLCHTGLSRWKSSTHQYRRTMSSLTQQNCSVVHHKLRADGDEGHVLVCNVMSVRPAVVEPARRWMGGSVTPFRDNSERTVGCVQPCLPLSGFSISGLSGITNSMVELNQPCKEAPLLVGYRQFYVGSLSGSDGSRFLFLSMVSLPGHKGYCTSLILHTTIYRVLMFTSGL
jgi:hypothetical protein